MFSLCIRAALVLVLLLGGAARASATPLPDTTRWVDADNTPWLREIRRQPAASDRSLAYWRAQAPTHPQPILLDIVLLDRLAAAEAVQDVGAAYPLHLAALRLARQLPYPQVQAEMLLHLADYHAQLAHYDSAATYLPAAERQFRLDRNLGGVVRCLGRLGRIAEQQGRYAASLGYYQQELGLATTGNTRRYHTDAQIELGALYARVNDYATARHYLREAQHAATQNDYPDRLNRALGELGEVYRQQRQRAAARTYFTRSIALSHQLQEVPYALAKQLSLAQLCEDQAQYLAAAAEGRQVLALAQAARLPLLVPLAQALLARLALRAGQTRAAIAYGRQSLAGSRQTRLLAGVDEASAVLAEAYTQQRAYGPALAALRQHNAAHDSLTGDNTRRRADLLQYGYERQQQLSQIQLLTQQNRFQAQSRELERVRAQRTLIGLVGLVLLAGGLGGGLFWQYRRRQQAQRAQAATALRQRLAADLHDDVGALLTQMSLQADLLRETPATVPDQVQARLLRLSDTSRQAARQMADVVWGLHASSTTLPEVLAHMRDHAHEVLPLAGLAVRFTIGPEVADARPSVAVCQTLYLLYKEALHNVIKHAHGATQVVVSLTCATGQLQLLIGDNAPGPAQVFRPGGQGLGNMRRRAEAVGGSLQVQPTPTGFELRACLPTFDQMGK